MCQSNVYIGVIFRTEDYCDCLNAFTGMWPFFSITDTSLMWDSVGRYQQSPWKWLDHDNKSLCSFYLYLHGDVWPLTILWQIALFCLVPKRWVCTFRACIKASSLKPRIYTLATTALIPSSGLVSSEDRFLTVYLSCYFFPYSLGWSYVLSLHSLPFYRDAFQVIHCFHISHCFHILRWCSCWR